MNSIDLSTPPEELQRGSRLGPYELLLRVGRGGMATVWVARERGPTRQQDRLVAVKAILADLAAEQDFVRMFLDEGRIVRAIRHENVVDVYEVAEDRGVTYMAMEWVEGDSLHAVISEAGRRRPVPAEMAVRIIADAAAGLHAAHELKDEQGQSMDVVHRDISPHNILIGVDGMIKIVDFGVARAMGRASEATSAGQLKGKFGYMSPEQAMAKRVDRRADVFALGIVLFELTTGRRLFRGEHDAETLHLVVSGKIPAPTSFDPNYPKALEAIVLRALERDLDKRFQTALELQQELTAFLKAERVVVPRAGVANLLKKVLGARIDQRRKAIRSSLRALDGDAPAGVNVPPSDPLAAPPPESTGTTGISSVTSPSSVSHVSSPSQPSSLSSPSGLSHPSAVSQVAAISTSGTRPLAAYGQFAQHGSGSHAYAPPPVVVVKKGGGLVGYAIGVFGLAVALGVIAFFLLKPPARTTTIVNLTSSAAAPEPSVAPTAPAAVDMPAEATEPPPEASEAPPVATAAKKSPPRPFRPPPVAAPPKAKEPAGPAPPRPSPYE